MATHPLRRKQVALLRAISAQTLADRIAEFINEHPHVHHISTTVEMTGLPLNSWIVFIVWSEV